MFLRTVLMAATDREAATYQDSEVITYVLCKCIRVIIPYLLNFLLDFTCCICCSFCMLGKFYYFFLFNGSFIILWN